MKRQEQLMAAALGAGALFLVYQIGSQIMSRAATEYVGLPDRVRVIEETTATHERWITEETAEKRAAREAAATKAADDERKALWKDRIESEKRRDARLEKILSAIARCSGIQVPQGEGTP